MEENPGLDRKVLHVDDDPDILAIVGHSLSKRGYKPHSITDPELAMPWLADCSTRIVLLDIEMPGKDGLTLLQEIKKFDGGIQVIMLTGLVSMGTIIRTTRLGALDCFFKPIDQIEAVMGSVDQAYLKLERWRQVLQEWKLRRNNDGVVKDSRIQIPEISLDLMRPLKSV